MLACGEKGENRIADWTRDCTTHFMEASSEGSQEIFVDGRSEQLICRAGYLDDRQKASICSHWFIPE